MRMNDRTNEVLVFTRWIISLSLFLMIAAVPQLLAQNRDEFDSYKIRLEASWIYATPSGSIEGSSGSGMIDLKKTLDYNGYSSFYGKLDWRFARKHHLYVAGSPFSRSKETVLNRTIVFEGKTYDVGLTAQSTLDANLYGIGYQYDIIRRKRGHLGIAAQFNLFDSYASISAAAQVTGDGVHHSAVSASASLLAPIPVAGPEFRLYLANSPRLFVDGQVYGMYFFGYGNFVSTLGALGVSLTKHASIHAGYQMGSRLVVKNDSSSDRIGLRLTEQGAIAGIKLSF